MVSSFESVLANTPLGGLHADDMGLGKTIQAIALIVTSKEWLIYTPTLHTYHYNLPTCLNNQLESRNIEKFSGLSAASQHLPRPHLSLIIQEQHPTI
ncbi:hypothetical protein O181_079627 [Austropuccinia psidii MF-1]|uniref:SNF2 N-terminal domain-containing protein n=1 Tax=Austropuccinia psidii MF-1 TaxID=1389203 RepID=A0A9Q3FMF1_9BASI|nr:hypothetical protein [Austropuccinia psidii MF-1]